MMELVRALLFLPPAASTVANGVDLLHLFVISATMLISTFVFLAAAWFTVRYHRREHHQLTVRYVASVRHEVLTIAAVLAVFLLWWYVGYRQYLRMVTPPPGTDVVYVQAKQWMWKFTYPDGRSANNVLTVPAGRPIKLVMTSRDVIHSFYVPEFRTKMDVLPGRYTTTWFEATEPGTYAIWCTEYCGLAHSTMRGEVTVLSPADYGEWLRGRERELAESDCGTGPGSCVTGGLVREGGNVAVKRACVACHTLDGQPHVGPTWSRLYESERLLTDGRRVIADDAYLTRSMMEPQAEVVAGFAPVMPTYHGLLSAGETAALVELIKSLREGGGEPGVALPRVRVEPISDGGLP